MTQSVASCIPTRSVGTIKSWSTAVQALRTCGSELAHEGAGTFIGYRVFWIEHSRASSLPQGGVLSAKMSAPELASSRLKPVLLSNRIHPVGCAPTVGPASAGKLLICFKRAFHDRSHALRGNAAADAPRPPARTAARLTQDDAERRGMHAPAERGHDLKGKGRSKADQRRIKRYGLVGVSLLTKGPVHQPDIGCFG